MTPWHETGGPSPHLLWKELACHDGTAYPAEWRTTRAVTLSVAFERIRAAVASPIVVLSGYRTPTWNTKIGGTPKSQHMEGRAMDLQPPKGWTVDRFYAVIREVAEGPGSGINGLGRYPTFVHVDVRAPRADGRLTVWHGSRAWAEVRKQDT